MWKNGKLSYAATESFQGHEEMTGKKPIKM
jgi:hypothetical protein